ncbi:hypothetical protein [Dyadobacter sp.]|uniref:hypothetical protein n=1 Tax=Dyadobacter sp. TaxID=1914288 RepID=UPI003F71B70E
MAHNSNPFEFDLTENPASQIQKAVSSEEIPKIYANGFICARSNSDVMLVLQLNGQPSTVVNLSFTSAKTLAKNLQGIVDQIESLMGQQVMTIDEINSKSAAKS